MPLYLEHLKRLRADGSSHVSAAFLAGELGLHPVQVRKDLAAVSKVDGNPRVGFTLEGLIEDMEEFLGCKNAHEAVVAGVGNLGRALLSYKNFDRYGLSIIAGFDSDPAIIGTTVHDKEIFNVSRLSELCGRFAVHIGIITAPAQFAQDICDALELRPRTPQYSRRCDNNERKPRGLVRGAVKQAASAAGGTAGYM